MYVTWVTIVTLAVIQSIAGVIVGATGFGSAIIAQLLWGVAGEFSDDPIIGNLQVLLGCLLLADFVGSSLLFFKKKHRDFIRWELVLAFWPAMAIFAPVGTWVLSTKPPEVLKQILGLLFLFTATAQIVVSLIRAQPRRASVATDDSTAVACPDAVALPIIKPSDKSTAVSVYPVTSGPASDDALDVGENALDAHVDMESGMVSLDARDSNRGCPAPAVHATVLKDLGEAPPYDMRSKIQAVGKRLAVFGREKLLHWRILAAVFVGCIAGFLGGLFGTSGPPVILYVAIVGGLAKGEVRATFAFISTLNLPITIGSAIKFGVYQADLWPLYIVGPVAAFFSYLCGKWLHNRAPVDTIMLVILGLVWISGLAFIQIFDPNVLTWVGVSLAVASIVTVVGTWVTLRLMRSRGTGSDSPQ